MFRFSLRCLLAVVSVVCIGIGLFSAHLAKQRSFTSAKAELYSHGVHVLGRHNDCSIHVIAYKWSPTGRVKELLNTVGPVHRLRISADGSTSDLPTLGQLDRLFSIRGLQRVELWNGRLPKETFATLHARIPGLRELLVMDGEAAEWCDLSQLPLFHRLSHLHLEDERSAPGLPTNDSNAIVIPTMPELTSAMIAFMMPVEIHSMPNVERIEVRSGLGAGDSVGRVTLELCPNLRVLDIAVENAGPNDCPLRTPDLLATVSSQPKLQALVLRGPLIHVGDVIRMAEMKSLESLELNGGIELPAVAAMALLDQVSQLELNVDVWFDSDCRDVISASSETDDDISDSATAVNWGVLVGCRNLKSLELSVSDETADSFLWLHEMRQLNTLDISGSSIASQHFRKIALSDLGDLSHFAFLDELVVAEIDVDEAVLRDALPNTKVSAASGVKTMSHRVGRQNDVPPKSE